MSNLKKVGKQRLYKERGQPSWHQKTGFLQKKKDYVVRAKDYHQKKEKLNKLKEAAFFRNPDEFSKQMVEKQVRIASDVNSNKLIKIK